jgi:hypothetical protein
MCSIGILQVIDSCQVLYRASISFGPADANTTLQQLYGELLCHGAYLVF